MDNLLVEGKIKLMLVVVLDIEIDILEVVVENFLLQEWCKIFYLFNVQVVDKEFMQDIILLIDV